MESVSAVSKHLLDAHGVANFCIFAAFMTSILQACHPNLMW
jgi:hypothetical protein